jgi:chaperonin GroES
MNPKLLKSSQLGEFVPFPYSGKNESGYEPIGDRVLVGPDMASDMTSGGVALTADHVDRTTQAAETGVIVAVGANAFRWNFDRTRPWEGPKPQPGDRIYVQRYSGQVMLGEDGRFYRLMDYACVGAVKVATPVNLRDDRFEFISLQEQLLREKMAKGEEIT